jgi:homocysteine S-methyltransferase
LEFIASTSRPGPKSSRPTPYGASRLKLTNYGLDDRHQEINVSAARIARRAAEKANHDVFVAGAISPLGVRIEPYGPTSLEDAREIFRAQAEALLEGGVDCFILETFHDLSEIQQAIKAVRELCDLVIFAQVTINDQGETAYGTRPEIFTPQLDEWLNEDGADVMGLNCSVGPQTILSAIEHIRPLTNRRLSAQPNAGMPRDVQGRQMYMCSPEYMAKYAKRLINAGVKFVGGCCGTTPAHIKLIADAVRALSPGRSTVHAIAMDEQSVKVDPVPFAERSRFSKKLASGEFVTSVEIVPPKGCDAAKMIEGVKGTQGGRR